MDWDWIGSLNASLLRAPLWGAKNQSFANLCKYINYQQESMQRFLESSFCSSFQNLWKNELKEAFPEELPSNPDPLRQIWEVYVSVLCSRTKALAAVRGNCLGSSRGTSQSHCLGSSRGSERRLAIGRSQQRNTACGPNPPACLEIQTSIQRYLYYA